MWQAQALEKWKTKNNHRQRDFFTTTLDDIISLYIYLPTYLHTCLCMAVVTPLSSVLFQKAMFIISSTAQRIPSTITWRALPFSMAGDMKLQKEKWAFFQEHIVSHQRQMSCHTMAHRELKDLTTSQPVSQPTIKPASNGGKAKRGRPASQSVTTVGGILRGLILILVCSRQVFFTFFFPLLHQLYHRQTRRQRSWN